jgi:hypothetical protein
VLPATRKAVSEVKLSARCAPRIAGIARNQPCLRLMLACSGLFRVTRGWNAAQGDAQALRQFKNASSRRGQGDGGLLRWKPG